VEVLVTETKVLLKPGDIMALTLWISLGLLVIASFLPKSFNSRFILGGSGWIFLSIYWSGQLGGYIELKDYVNIILVIAATAASLFIAHITFQAKIILIKAAMRYLFHYQGLHLLAV